MKKVQFIVIILVVILLSACNNTKDVSTDVDELEDPELIDNNNDDKNNSSEMEELVEEPVIIKGDMVITRAVAAKMIALANFDKKTIEISDREIDFNDTTPDNWFDKYINIVVINKWMLGGNKSFNPLRPLTNKELETVSKRFDINLQENNINIDSNDNVVKYNDFMTFYDVLCKKSIDESGVITKNLIVFSTPANSTSLKSWQMATNCGIYSFEGLTMDCYLDKEIQVIMRDGEIVGIKKIVNETPKLTNAYIEEINGNIATVFMGGASREYTINHDEYKHKKNCIGDIVIDNGHIASILLKENMISNKVLSISNNEVDFTELGVYSLAKDIKVYSVVDGLHFKNVSNIIVGYSSTNFIVDNEGCVCAAIIRDKVDIKDIRVLISTNNFASKYHKKVELTASTDYVIEYADSKKQVKANEMTNINNDYFTDCNRIYIKPLNNGKITISSIKRGGGNNPFAPSYRGVMEIVKKSDGYLIVNEVPIEEYLYAVVPSEMPTSYGLEAAKTQAVCARSYAYVQFNSNSFCKYGAHVIDSVSSQVYNNAPENDVSINAVNATSNLGLTYNDNVISTNFFSTSCGYTASSGDVWANSRNHEFPTSSPKYLTGNPQFDEKDKYKDMQDEKVFRKFILDNNIDSYDKEFSYYRWSVLLTKEHIESTINNTIGSRYKIQPKQIKTLDENNIFRSRYIDSIGELKDIEIYKRGSSGIITQILIKGSKGVLKVSTEYNIRLLISPYSYVNDEDNIPVVLQDNREVKVSSASKLMPSAFYFMDKEYDKNGNLVKILFRGGGYGHGVGMSQNGVKGMVDKGYKYDQILNHYYNETKIKKIY